MSDQHLNDRDTNDPDTKNQYLHDLELSDALSSKPFAEVHHRIVDRPIDEVWQACLAVTAKEVRLLGPLMTFRTLPRLFRHGRAITVAAPKPLLDVFAKEGFTLLRRDKEPRDGRALVLFGAAGRFWSISENAPLPFSSPQEFLDFAEPNYAKTVATLEATDLGNGTTKVETVTWVAGTDAEANKKFAPYWMVIRGGSGLIRRSWLAAINRRVLHPASV